MNDLQQHGFKATMLHLDVTHPGEQSLAALKEFAPTHLYYFATPKISSADKTLNEDRFRTFSDYYIFALHRLIEYLKPAGLRNVFVPSSIAITELPKDMMEYAFAKAAMECWVKAMREKRKIFVYAPRFPRIKTAQTQTLLSVPAAAAEDILFPEMLKFEENSLYD